MVSWLTAAVEQPVLDIWASSKGGCQISPFIEGVLGKRPNFVKGRDHFAYISRTVDGATIYFIADAPSELSMARSLSAEYKIVPIGFAYSVQRDDVLEALSQGQLLLKSASGWQLKPPRLLTETISVPPQSIELPGAAQDLASTLLAAGGDFVVRGDAQVIMSNLKDLLETIT